MERINESEVPRIMAMWPRPYNGFRQVIEGLGGWETQARDPRRRPRRFSAVVELLIGQWKEA